MTLPKSSLDCDVVIVNFNAGNLLVECVSSAFSASAGQVFVIDNGSSDHSLEHLEEETITDERLSVIRNSKNVGFAAGCNIGARRSTASRLLFLNPDCVLAPGSLERMAAVLDRSETAGMAGGRLSNPDGSEQRGGRRNFPTPTQAFMRAFGLFRLSGIFRRRGHDFLLHENPLPDEPVAVEAVSGACMLVKREALDDVGLWDEGYFLHCEDLDWCMRFRQKGWEIVFVPDAVVFHDKGTCSRSRPIRVEWHKHKGMVRFYRKFYRQRYPALLWPVIVAGVVFRFILIAGYFAVQNRFSPGVNR